MGPFLSPALCPLISLAKAIGGGGGEGCCASVCECGKNDKKKLLNF